MGHVLAIRSETRSLFRVGIFSNIRLLGAVAIAVILQMAITYMPLLQPVFRTESLSAWELLWVVIASSLVFAAVECEKAIFRNRRINR